MKIKVTFEVNENTIKKVSGKDNINDAINTELGWVAQSGISVENIEIFSGCGHED